MLGCYGHPDMKTPALDRLAAEGIRFDRAYCCQPVCGPARSAIFTGLFPHSNGVFGNSLAPGVNIRTVGQRMRDHGFHTAYIGKWHLDGGDYFGLGKCPPGWDDAYWYDMKRYLDELSPADRVRSRFFETSHEVDETFTFGHRVSNRAVDFLDKHADEDFLLVVSYDEPHGPYLCPKPWCDLYADYEFPKSPNVWDRLEDKPEHLRLWAGRKLAEDKDALKIGYQHFLGCNAFVDHQIGRVLNAVDRLVPGALVVYTSDHGDMMHSHSITNKGPAMFDEITRIPFIVRWPGVAPEGQTCPHPVSHIDVVPTLMDAAGLDVPKWLDGVSLVETFADPTVRANDAVFMEFHRYEIDHDGFGGFQPIRCVTDGRYKLVVNLLDTDELYDLANDPHEMTNLIDSSEHAKVRDALHDRLLLWMDETRDVMRGYHWRCRPWRPDAKPTWDGSGKTRQVENEEYEDRQLDYNTGLPMTEATRSKGGMSLDDARALIERMKAGGENT
ncbi:MAG TPA: sulfatase-like hydrolase/transferase, partial [Planctomycetota bacterium]|nr:sulfatase-like hydrolase/transferase [Planctomycetota bacterium]